MSALRGLWQNPKARFGTLCLLMFAAMATVGPVLVPLQTETNLEHRFELPSLTYPLGTDYAGRDIWSQIVHGSTDVLLIAFSAAVFGTGLAIVFGFTAGWAGGRTDSWIMRMSDVILTLPRFALMAIAAGLLSIGDPFSFGLILAIFDWPALARALRNQVMTLKQADFIEVCQIMGLSTRHILFRELLPNTVPFIAINFIAIAKGAVTASVGIMMLGIVPLSFTNWGMMLSLALQTGALYLPNAYPYFLAPILFIILLQLSLILFAAGLEELYDPRLA